MNTTIGEWRSSTSGPELLPLHDTSMHPTVESNIQYQISRQRFRSQLFNPCIKKNMDHNIVLFLTQPTEAIDFDIPSTAFDIDGLTRTRLQSYASRINELGTYARDDGYHLNPESEVDFWRFIELVHHFRRGSLVLMDNGNIRAIWKGGQGSHLGLQFLGGGMAQYVIFRRRGSGQQISRVAGRDSLKGVLRQIDAFDLDALLYK